MDNLSTVMLWKDACVSFEENVLPYVREAYEADGIPDWPARREAWNNWTDGLCKDYEISNWQYANWSQPTCCGA